MAKLIVGDGYEASVRNRLGVKSNELPDADINDKFIIDFAESIIIERVPDYATITSSTDLLYLQNAVICYVCYLLLPSMPRRIKTQVQTLDVTWKIEKTDWEKLGVDLIGELEHSLSKVTSVSVVYSDVVIMKIAKRS